MRVKFQELTINRIGNAITRRLAEVPNRFTFKFSLRGRQNSNALKGFKDKHLGETAILLANGPSLAKEDLSITSKYTTFGLNRIYLGIEKFDINLDYIVCINTLVLNQYGEEIQNVDCQKFLSWSSRKILGNREGTYWLGKGFISSSFSLDISKGIMPGATVTYAALQLIYYMGFKKVIILGMDHNFTLDKSKIPNTKETYTHTKDVNHFVENYFPQGVKWETPDLITSEYVYQVARDRFEADGRQIYDCTTGGKCEIFVKTSVNQALNG